MKTQIKSLQAALLLVLVLVSPDLVALDTAVAKDWPKESISEAAQIKIYQPQINSLEGDLLDGRAALSVKRKGESMVFGAIWFKSRLATDFDTRTVTLTKLEIESVKFPDASEAETDQLISLLQEEIPLMDLTFSLDRLLTTLENVEKENQFTEQLNHQAPAIHFAKEPTVLALIDGEAILKDIENSNVQYVVNTPYFILYNKADGFYYLKGGKWWYRAGRVEDSWRQTSNTPASLVKIADQAKAEGETDVDSIAASLDYPPKLIVSTVPAELVITDGEPDFSALENTSLLYVSNTESDILLDINTQDYYILLAGRWYRARSLGPDNWSFVSPDQLPADFASILTESEMGSVRASIPGTQEASEALMESEIPQTAVIDRNAAKLEVEYDGAPEFAGMDGTNMSYARNTDKSVLKIAGRFYCVDNGVWFESATPTGTWVVSVAVPDQVQEIPPQYPVYNVKYVYIYDNTPDLVYTGYTPGYTYSYHYRGTVVWGTGYYYRPWYRNYYYPSPVTYGYGVHYNPYSGWGFSVGVSYGWLGYGYYRPYYYYTSYWGPAGYRYGYRHGYYPGHHRDYYQGYYQGYRYGSYTVSHSGNSGVYYSGYNRGYSSGHSDAYSQSSRNNVYENRTTGVRSTGSRDSRSSYSKPSTADKKNNVYTDRVGNVYRQKGDTWQTREDGTWKKETTATSRERTSTPAQSQPSTTSRQAVSTPAQSQPATTSREAVRTPAQSQGTTSTQRTTTPAQSQSTTTSRERSSTSSQGAVSSGSRSSTSDQLNRESAARSQGSQRTYNYQQSQPPVKKTVPATGNSGGSTQQTESQTTRKR